MQHCWFEDAAFLRNCAAKLSDHWQPVLQISKNCGDYRVLTIALTGLMNAFFGSAFELFVTQPPLTHRSLSLTYKVTSFSEYTIETNTVYRL